MISLAKILQERNNTINDIETERLDRETARILQKLDPSFDIGDLMAGDTHLMRKSSSKESIG